ncbi:hypothetical protein BHE74_00011738 [Ensete ventricosum]|nr:hypothetical protein BHE74_00011738 [Ensete ventricosum]
MAHLDQELCEGRTTEAKTEKERGEGEVRWDFAAMLMKKGKRSAMESSPVSTYYPVSQEAKTRFRHQSLLQDYENLLKETEAKRRKLQKADQKKLKLLAEIKL